jgi:HAE1 family hydrophobic/amphiphilic exporter-1
VTEHLIVGSFLAAIVVLVFLWNFRSTIIAAIAIPTSIISTFGLIWYMGFTLNVMTMLALTLSVGIVIDDAIVVLENIYRFVEEKGRPPFEAAVEATKEIGLAVMATTLSLEAIFVPVGFMGGIVGRFMKSFGLTMAFAIGMSLLVSFTLTPMMSARWIRPRANGGGGAPRHTSRDSWLFRPLDHGYTRLLEWALAHRGLVVLASVLVLLSSVPLGIVVNKTFMPMDDQSEFEVTLRAPEGTSLESTQIIANRVAKTVRERYPEVTYTMVTVADDTARTPNSSVIYVRLADIEKRARNQFDIMDDVRQKVLPAFAAARLRATVRQAGGGMGGAAIQFVINGPDLDKLNKYATAVASRAKGLAGVVDVDITFNPGRPEVAVELDRAKAADLGIQVADAGEALRLLVGGDRVTTYAEGDEQYDVFLRAESGNRNDASAIGRLTVPSARLGSVPLENLATLSRSEAPTDIARLQRERQVTVVANILPGASQTPAMTAMQEAAAELNMGPDYRTRFAGQSREMARAARNFMLAFLLSLAFMYMVLAAQFESWLHPVTILLALPLTLPFALIAIFLTGQSVNVMSALGLLVLFGVVKKNSILQIDHANQLLARGMPLREAVVRASRDRLRPILMTTLAFVAGMIPLVISGGIGAGTNRAIGFVIIGGQSLVLVLTLVVTPVAYSLFDDASHLRLGARVRALVARLAGGRTPASESDV